MSLIGFVLDTPTRFCTVGQQFRRNESTRTHHNLLGGPMLRTFAVLLTSLVSLSPTLLLAQNQDDIAGAAAGAGGCLACGGFLMFVVIGIIALNIALLVWVYRDATNRGMENPILWLVIVLV